MLHECAARNTYLLQEHTCYALYSTTATPAQRRSRTVENLHTQLADSVMQIRKWQTVNKQYLQNAQAYVG